MSWYDGRRSPRIGLYDSSPVPGGQSIYVGSILDGLSDEPFDVTLFGDPRGPHAGRKDVRFVAVTEPERPSAEPAPRPHARASLRSRLWRSSMPAGVRLWAGFGREALRLARIIRANPVDLFHTNNTGPEESAPAAWLAGTPRIVGTFHIDPSYDIDRRRDSIPHRILEFLGCHSLGRAIAVSDSTSEGWRRRTLLPGWRMITIRNGIDPARFARRQGRAEARRRLGLLAEGLIVGAVGRLAREKGIETLLEATALLASRLPDFSVAIAGDGPLERSLADRASALGIDQRVRFLGHRDEIRDVYEAIDIFALPSRCESLGFVFLEAMASSLPVVGPAVGGVPEVVVPGTTGFLVDPNDPPALAAALERLLGSGDLRAAMGEAGQRRVVAEFDRAAMVSRTIGLYHQLLPTHLRGHAGARA